MLLTVGGWLASLAVAGYSAIAVRNLVKTEMIAAEPMEKPSPFSSLELAAWCVVSVASFAAALKYPELLGTSARTCLPFLLGSTVIGYMVGSGYNSFSLNLNLLRIDGFLLDCCFLLADVW